MYFEFLIKVWYLYLWYLICISSCCPFFITKKSATIWGPQNTKLTYHVIKLICGTRWKPAAVRTMFCEILCFLKCVHIFRNVVFSTSILLCWNVEFAVFCEIMCFVKCSEFRNLVLTFRVTVHVVLIHLYVCIYMYGSISFLFYPSNNCEPASLW